MIARGLLNTNGLKQILRELAAVTIPCVNCRVLIDVIDAEYKVKQLLAGAVETRRLAAVGFSFIAVGSGGLWNPQLNSRGVQERYMTLRMRSGRDFTNIPVVANPVC